MKAVQTEAVALVEASGPLVKHQPTPAEILQAVVERGVTADNAQAVKEIIGLMERMEDRNAEKQFAAAFVELQKEIPRIQATKVIPDRNGNVRSSFAPFEAIDAQARPICLKHGFSYSFSEGEAEPGKITKICILQHTGGHHKQNPYTVRIGQGPPGCTESQSDGSAHSYAKRGALCDCLNIVVIGIDNDARNEGGNVTAEQATDLRRRVNETQTDSAKFFKLAGTELGQFDKIPALLFPILDEMLSKKERLKKA